MTEWRRYPGTLVAGFRQWGIRSTLGYAVRRAGWRAWNMLQGLEFWEESAWRRQYLVRRGARISWPMLAPWGVKVIGSVAQLHVGSYSSLAAQTTYLTLDPRLLPFFGCWHKAPIRLGEHVHMGNGAVVCPGVSIGPRAAVAAFSVVARDVMEDAIVSGRPARVVGSFKRYYHQRIDDLAKRPHLYTESFDHGRSPAPWDDLSEASQSHWLRTTGGTRMTGLRRWLRTALFALWDQLQEQDDFRASQQRIFLMRKQGYAIGDHSYIDPRAVIDLRAQQVSVGQHCVIGPCVSILAHDGFCANYTGRVRVEPVRILDGCAIGAASVILPGVTIGPGSVVEPGSTVLLDVPPYTVVSGSPARRVASLSEWMAERQKEIDAHPEHYVAEPRFVPYSVPGPEALAPAPQPREVVAVAGP